MGNLPPDEVVVRGIETLQLKLAGIAVELNKDSVEANSTAAGGFTTYGGAGADSPANGYAYGEGFGNSGW